MPRCDIHVGDALTVLREMESGSAHTCITSPPYFGLRDYGAEGQIGLEPTPAAYVARLVEVFAEVWRVLRDDGTLFLNLGDSYARNPAKGGSGTYNGRNGYGEEYRGAGLAGLKEKDLIGIPWSVAFALRDAGWYLRCDVIWCLSGGTRVYARTQKGEMPTTIKDLVRLDPSTVQLWNGEKWTQVLGWNETPRPDAAFEIELRSGERIGCTAGHLWPTQRGNVRADELQAGDVIRTCRLPEPASPLSTMTLPDELVGRFVGLYIAEGSMSGDCIQIASHADEAERFEDLRFLAKCYDGTCRMHKTGGNKATINLYSPVLRGILDAYVVGKGAKGKHLAPRAWRRSGGFLAAVLDGYLSGDGHLDEKNGRWRLGFTRNDAWAADLRTLCARLGYSLRLRRCNHTMHGRAFPGYRGQIRFEQSEHHNSRDDGEVVAIRRSKGRKFWDIGVEDEPHLFALASGVLTHNSKPNPMPESVTDRPTRAHEYLFLLSKRPRYYFDSEAVREDGPTYMRKAGGYADAGSGIGEGTGGQDGRRALGFKGRDVTTTGRNIRSVWHIATAPFPGAHFAVFPPALVTPCILAGTSEKGCCSACGSPYVRQVERAQEPDGLRNRNGGAKMDYHTRQTGSGQKLQDWMDANPPRTVGWLPSCPCDAGSPVPCTVLDPFAGAGTTALVALGHGRDAVLCEINPSYAALAASRVRDDAPLLNAVDVLAPVLGG